MSFKRSRSQVACRKAIQHALLLSRNPRIKVGQAGRALKLYLVTLVRYNFIKFATVIVASASC